MGEQRNRNAITKQSLVDPAGAGVDRVSGPALPKIRNKPTNCRKEMNTSRPENMSAAHAEGVKWFLFMTVLTENSNELARSVARVKELLKTDPQGK
jgi:hypothetical protein